MTKYGGSWSWPFRLVGTLGIGGAMIVFSSNCTLGQIQPDATLGAESSSVIRNVLTKGLLSEQIRGGARRGGNLFHSFEQFAIGENQRAYFTNPAGIKNILSRVTGNDPSDILGTLGVTGGNANLFLVNPNGIIFGPNASLDVNGSFMATTANALQFDSQGFFNASAPNIPSLLTINPSAFLFKQIAASIQNNSIAPAGLVQLGFSAFGLRVPDGQSLLLLGGNIGMDRGRLNAFGGRVEIGGIAGAGTVGLEADGNNLRLSFPDAVERADVSLSDEALVEVSGEGGGSVQIQGRRVLLSDESAVFADTLGSQNGRGVSIRSSQLVVRDGAGISVGIYGSGQGGNLSVTADTIDLIGESADGQVPSGFGTQNQGTGTAGDLTIKTGRLSVQGAQVSTGTYSSGQGGNLSVTADTIELSGTSVNGEYPGGLLTETQNIGAAGDLTIKTGSLRVQDGAQVTTGSNRQVAGQGGNLSVTADIIELIGESAVGRLISGLFTTTVSTEAAGDLTIKTVRLSVTEGARISTSTSSSAEGAGKGGNLNVTADTIELSGTLANGKYPGGLSTDAIGTGAAGDLRINVTKQLIVQGGSGVSVGSQATGIAGNLEITAPSIFLDNQGELLAENASGDGGNIELSGLDLLLMRRGGRMSATAGTAQAGGSGGNITIDTDFIVASLNENSDITANAFKGQGGNIEIETRGIFGLEERRATPGNGTNDIDASSQLGVAGTIALSTPDIDPSSGLVALPEEVVDASGLIAQTCPAGSGPRQSKFVVTGRGGIPSNPGDILNTDAVQVDLVTLNPEVNESSRAAVVTSLTRPSSTPMVEAQGWVRDAKGNVVLKANAPAVNPHSSWGKSAKC